jgi:hypothetical protein
MVNRYRKVRNLICFLLIASIILNSCTSTSGLSASAAQQQQQQQTEQIIGIALGVVVFTTIVCLFVAISNGSKAKAQKQADEAKFQACVGKTKAEIYTLYGPPDSIVDDGLNDGGSILEYHTIITSGGGRAGVSTTTYRKLFYLNKADVVTSVKEDTH